MEITPPPEWFYTEAESSLQALHYITEHAKQIEHTSEKVSCKRIETTTAIETDGSMELDDAFHELHAFCALR